MAGQKILTPYQKPEIEVKKKEDHNALPFSLIKSFLFCHVSSLVTNPICCIKNLSPL